MLLAQVTTASASAAAAIAVACIAGALAVTKKLLPTKDYITRAEFHNGLDSLRDHIDAVGSSIHSRLNQLDAAVTRLDERSRKCGVEQTARQHALIMNSQPSRTFPNLSEPQIFFPSATSSSASSLEKGSFP